MRLSFGWRDLCLHSCVFRYPPPPPPAPPPPSSPPAANSAAVYGALIGGLLGIGLLVCLFLWIRTSSLPAAMQLNEVTMQSDDAKR